MTDMFTGIVAELEADLRQTAVPAELTNEQRVAALFALVARAQHGDEDAKAKLTELRFCFPDLYEALAAHEPWPVTEPGTFDKPLAVPPDTS